MDCHLVTGGAGFIGSAYVLLARKKGIRVINLDKLSYSGNLGNLSSLKDDEDHIFIQGDIGDYPLVSKILKEHKPDCIVNFAAESHVDRSIVDPDLFVKNNVLGTVSLLRSALEYWEKLSDLDKEKFRFLHVSTDEVFGDLQPHDPPFTEKTPYAPNSPYSASKAASDHFVRSFYKTYGLPVLITSCSNNYGPRQFPEKLIPLTIVNALARKKLPIYGTGENIRDWLYVDDHCLAIMTVLQKGKLGELYTIGGRAEKNNLEVVRTICRILDKERPHNDGPYEDLISFVADRPGHDWRYAIDCSYLEKSLGWSQAHNFKDGIKDTVLWYLNNANWLEKVLSGAYRDWIALNYNKRQ